MYWIGMDVGSTCTKAVALDEGGNLVFYKVTPTGWNCVETASALMEAMATQGVCRQDARVVATGYGRVSIPFADKAVTEISCHGNGAAWLFGADAFTVIDIGGQDTKIIQVNGGHVQNFIMNDKCSAGTGRFLDIMAGTLGVTLDQLCELARAKRDPSANLLHVHRVRRIRSGEFDRAGREKGGYCLWIRWIPSPARYGARWGSWAPLGARCS